MATTVYTGIFRCAYCTHVTVIGNESTPPDQSESDSGVNRHKVDHFPVTFTDELREIVQGRFAASGSGSSEDCESDFISHGMEYGKSTDEIFLCVLKLLQNFFID